MDWNKVDNAVNTAGEVYSTAAKIGRVLMGLFFTVVGAGLLIWAVMWFSDRVSSMDEYVLTQGTVKELDKDRDPDGSDTYVFAPIVSYKDNNGNEHLHKSSSYSYPPDYEIGETVEIYYLPSSPKEAFINSFFEKWGIGIIIAIVGLVITPIGIWLVVSAFRKNTREFTSSSGSTENQFTGVRIG
ncbi:MAG: DUF3592 domain-containing protein [Ignavibacteriae bacterium]|nr:DUF3592 domain-containing protein [Ignavibacteriota bacterium]MCB9244708.1 DUF3592 domain-containing protein [Ignavibacteriales bacterium]